MFAVKHNLEKGIYDQCFACRMPIVEEDKEKPEYLKGISCHHCHDNLTDEQRKRFEEREKQMNLSEKRGIDHIGGEVASVIEKRRELKQQEKDNQKKITLGTL